MMSEPAPSDRAILEQRIRSEVPNLKGDDLAWWLAYRVEPFIVPGRGLFPYAVAINGDTILFYFPNRDSFGTFAPEPWNDSLALKDDLADAVRCFATQDLINRVLSETASEILRLGIFDRGDFRTRRRVLNVLGAFGPAAAIAVPKLIEIMNTERRLKEAAVATISAIGPRAAEAVPKLIEMAELDTANSRGWCLHAFKSIGPAAASAIPLLIDLLLQRARIDPDPFYVSMAARALGSIGTIEALPALLQVLRETTDPDIAGALIEAIGKLGTDAAEAGPMLAELVRAQPESSRFPEDEDIRNLAREALHRIGQLEVIDLTDSGGT